MQSCFLLQSFCHCHSFLLSHCEEEQRGNLLRFTIKKYFRVNQVYLIQSRSPKSPQDMCDNLSCSNFSDFMSFRSPHFTYIVNIFSPLSKNSFSISSSPGSKASNSFSFSWKPALSLMIATLAERTNSISS